MNPYVPCPECGRLMKPSSERCMTCRKRASCRSAARRETHLRCLQQNPEHEARIALYTERAELGLPLFPSRN